MKIHMDIPVLKQAIQQNLYLQLLTPAAYWSLLMMALMVMLLNPRHSPLLMPWIDYILIVLEL